MLKTLRQFAVVCALAAAALAQPGGIVIQVQNQGSTVGTYKKFLVLNCSTNLVCTPSGSTVAITATSTAATAFSAITASANANVGVFSASGNSWDFTATSIFKLRAVAGLTSSASGDIGEDTTSGIWHLWTGADSTIPAATSTTTTSTFALFSTGVLGKYAPRAIVIADLPAATVFNNQVNTYSGGFLQNFSADDFLSPVHATDPATCTAGQFEFNSTGASFKGCTATNTWSVFGTTSPAFSSLTAGANSNTGTFSASGNSWDFTATAIFKLRSAAGATSSANGDFAFDTTSGNWHGWNGADRIFAPLASGFVSGHCGAPTNTAGKWEIADAGACGGVPNPAANGVVECTGTNCSTSTTVGAPAGAIVGTTDTQALSGKTVDISANTVKTATNTAGHYPRNNGTQYVDGTIQAADVPILNQNTTGNAATVTTSASATNSAFSILVAPSTSGSQAPNTVASFTINPSTGAVNIPGAITVTSCSGCGGGSLPTATTAGQSPVSSGSGTSYNAQNPGLADSPNSPVDLTSAGYTLVCPNGTNQQDNMGVVRLINSAAHAVTIPLSTGTTCGKNGFVVKNVTGSSVTINATSTDTLTITGTCGSDCGTAKTTFTLPTNGEFTANQGASGIWEVRETNPAPTALPPNGTAGGVLSGSYPNPGFAAGSLNGTDAKVQTGTGSFTANNMACGDANGGVTPCTTTPTGMVLGNGVTASTQSADDNSTNVATTAYVDRMKVRTITFTFGAPEGSALSSSITRYVTVPFGCTISAYNLLADAGTFTVKFWKIASGTAIPTVTNSISTSGVSLASGTALHSTTVTDFTTTTVSANDIMAANITAVSTAKMVQAQLECDQ